MRLLAAHAVDYGACRTDSEGYAHDFAGVSGRMTDSHVPPGGGAERVEDEGGTGRLSVKWVPNARALMGGFRYSGRRGHRIGRVDLEGDDPTDVSPDGTGDYSGARLPPLDRQAEHPQLSNGARHLGGVYAHPQTPDTRAGS